ncbi:MAG: chorismate mutase [Verrucomicrobia bacterium]|nr:chorismate mutase [Verrucomicrobiota bacterium]
MNPNAELQTIRRAIDALDEAMADLLASRICLSHQAQQIKSRAGLPIRDETREEEIRYRYDLRWRGAAVVAMATGVAITSTVTPMPFPSTAWLPAPRSPRPGSMSPSSSAFRTRTPSRVTPTIPGSTASIRV